uniref:acireductone dioxygenase (Fe(2+)-requiring) n=1 Tax=Phlebotomus papatasi TaxID=29031 RepID=A0A1B0DNK8_PHLPP
MRATAEPKAIDLCEFLAESELQQYYNSINHPNFQKNVCKPHTIIFFYKLYRKARPASVTAEKSFLRHQNSLILPEKCLKNCKNMVRAWFMDTETTDQRLEHQRNPPEFVTLEDLYAKTGVEYFKIDVDNHQTDDTLQKVRKDRGYSYEDQITCSKECLPDYESKLKNFFTEHLHTDEEIRLVMDGSGYFDVRE